MICGTIYTACLIAIYKSRQRWFGRRLERYSQRLPPIGLSLRRFSREVAAVTPSAGAAGALLPGHLQCCFALVVCSLSAVLCCAVKVVPSYPDPVFTSISRLQPLNTTTTTLHRAAPPSSSLLSAIAHLPCLCPGLQLLATRCSCLPPFHPLPSLSRAPAPSQHTTHARPGIVSCFRSIRPRTTAHSRLQLTVDPFDVNSASTNLLH